MNRVAVRIAALTTVVGVGLGGITQAQRMLRARKATDANQTAGADVAAADSSLLAKVSAGAEAASGDEPEPFDRDRSNSDAASTDRYPLRDTAGDEPIDPPFTERPEGDDDAAEVDVVRGQPVDESDGAEPALIDTPEDVPPLGARQNRAPADGGRIARTRFNEPDLLPSDSGAPIETQPTDGASSEPADEGGQPEAMPPAAGDYEMEDPVAPATEEPVPAAAPPSSSRRNARAMGEPAPLEPSAAPQEPVPSAVPEPAADDSLSPREETRHVPAGDAGGVEGSGRPGQTELEGRQSHALELEKHFPDDAQVGQPASIAIKLRNAGSAVARRLEIVDAVPQGTRLVATRPQAELDARGAVRWAIAELKPGEEANVTMEVLPLVEGELGSVATVHYAAEASARAVVTRPVLKLEVVGPKQVLIGDDATLAVKVTNTGTGVARGLVLGDRIPEGLSHPSGSELEREVGDLRPGESHEVQLTVKGAKAGRYINVVAARGEGETQAEDRSEIEVIAPDLAIELIGGSRRYLERPAKFTLAIANNGTAPARGVEIAAELPPGLDFVEATHYGQHDEKSRTVRWSLDELPAGQVGNVELTLRPSAEGEHKLAIRATGQPLTSFEKEQVVSVEGIATTMFEVVDVEDPVEEGGETSYEVRVVNQGTKSASNVQIVAVLPEGMQAIDADGPTRHQIDGQRVLFDPVERLAPKADTSFRIRVKALKAGEMRVNVQLMTGDMKTPLTEEESTRVYSNK